MYQNGFVVVVKINGKTVEEKDGKIIIPFDSEYSLMLKNRNDRKAVARVYIDGEEVTQKGRLIIDSNNSVNLERYIDDMNNGKKFKFVPVADVRVNDKGDSEKGYVEVRFQLVKPVLNNFVIHEEHIHHRHHHHHDYWPNWTWGHSYPFYIDYTPNYTFGTLTCNSIGGGTCCNSSITASNSGSAFMNYTCDSTIEPINKSVIQDNHLVEERGATIKGSDSSQKFCYSYVGELEAQETVIRFQLVGTKDEKIMSQYCKTHCTQCGKAYDVNDNYCAKCGTKK